MAEILGFNDVEFDSFAVPLTEITEVKSIPPPPLQSATSSSFPFNQQEHKEEKEDDNVSLRSINSSRSYHSMKSIIEDPNYLEEESEEEQEIDAQSDQDDEEDGKEEISMSEQEQTSSESDEDEEETENENEDETEKENEDEDKKEVGMLDPLTGYCLIQTVWSSQKYKKQEKPIVYLYETKEQVYVVGVNQHQLLCRLPITHRPIVNLECYTPMTFKTKNLLDNQLSKLKTFETIEHQKKYLGELQSQVGEPILLCRRLVYFYYMHVRGHVKHLSLLIPLKEDDEDKDERIDVIWVADSNLMVLGGLTSSSLTPTRFDQSGFLKEKEAPAPTANGKIVSIMVPELEAAQSSPGIIIIPEVLETWAKSQFDDVDTPVVKSLEGDPRFVWSKRKRMSRSTPTPLISMEVGDDPAST